MDHTGITFEGLAEKAEVVEGSTGDLHISGWAAKYNEPDRQQEYFMPGAFARTWEKFRALGAPLLYQHKDGAQLGQVTSLQEKAEGVWMEGVIPKPTEPWAADVYNRLKRGMVKGLSAKGMFTKQLIPEGGARIKDVDLYEVSVTPVAVGAGATIEAVAQKALAEMEAETPDERQLRVIDEYFTERFDRINAEFEALRARLPSDE